jgi:hypothetical protein
MAGDFVNFCNYLAFFVNFSVVLTEIYVNNSQIHEYLQNPDCTLANCPPKPSTDRVQFASVDCISIAINRAVRGEV